MVVLVGSGCDASVVLISDVTVNVNAFDNNVCNRR